MKVGFAAIVSLIASAASEEVVEIPPSKFDPLKPRSGRGASGQRTAGDTVHCGPNQMARLMSGMVELI